MRVLYGPYIKYFLWAFVFGIVLAFIYDGIRLLRKIIKHKDFVVNLEDSLFLAFAGIMSSIIAYMENYGRLRLYGIIGTIMGFSLYRFLLKDRVVKGFWWLWVRLCKAITIITNPVIKGTIFIKKHIGQWVCKIVKQDV